MRRAVLMAAAVWLAASASVAETPAEADSLLALIEETGVVPEETDLPPPSAPGTGPRPSLDAGGTPTSRWVRIALDGDGWSGHAGRRDHADGIRTDLGLAAGGGRLGAAAGRLALRAGAGLLLGGGGRDASPSAGQGLRGGRTGWRPVRGAPSDGTLRGAVLALGAGPVRLAAAAGEADRDAGPGGGGVTRRAWLRLGGKRAAGTVAWLAEAAGAGAGVGLSLDGARVSGAVEAALWRPAPDGAPRAAWTAVAALGGRGGRIEGQLAVREPGFAPRAGRRPAVLGARDRRGWALRWRGRPGGTPVAALVARARGTREVDGLPASTDVRRLELVVSGRGGDLAWRIRAADRAETLRGWADRAPWLPPAEISARRVVRLSARVDGPPGPVRWRAEAATTVVSTRDAGAASPPGRRDRLALRVDRDLGAGVLLRFGQVWAWGDPVDLVSVESPAPGLLRPRHWGRRDRERSLGLVRRTPRWRLAVAVTAWEGPDGTAGAEVLARLAYAP